MHIIIGSIFFGAMLFIIPDVVFFIGIKNSYLDFYGVEIYFNPFFVESQSIFVFLAGSILCGYLVLYSPISKLFQYLYVVLILASTLTFIPDIGKSIGKKLYMSKNIDFKIGDINLHGDIIYQNQNALFILSENRESATGFLRDEIEIVE